MRHTAQRRRRAAGPTGAAVFERIGTAPLSEKTRDRVVIVGGGFGGVFTARHLRRRAGGDVHIELISRNNFFVFQPLLPEVAGGNIHPADAVSPLRLFLPGVSVPRCRSPKDRRSF